jgi:hypothetical protein
MSKPIHEMSSWDPSLHPSRSFEEDVEEEAWEATRQQTGVATQLMRDKDEYLAEAKRHIGRRIAPSQWELFVSCEPADAMQQQFEAQPAEYIALHDIGTQSSRRMLAGLAAATGGQVHQLHIRRQGLGMALARLEFVELPVPEGQRTVRLYTTETDADSAQRRRLARILLAYSRLGVVMVGDLPPHALATALLPLRDAIAEGPWYNRELLMLPLAGAGTLAGQAARIAGRVPVQIRTTPLVTRPAEAWSFLRGTWNKLRERLAEDAVDLPEILDPVTTGAPAATAVETQAPAPTPSLAQAAAAASSSPLLAPSSPRAPLPMQPMPSVARAAPASATVDPVLATYVRRCGELKGMISCCIFELASQRTLAHAGGRPGPAALASQGASLMASMAEAAQALNLGDAAPDAAITFSMHHELLRAVPKRPGLAMHAVLDRAQGNLTLVRLQLQRLDLLLEEGSFS